MASTYSSSNVHIASAAFSWQMPYKFFYKFLKTKEKDEHVLGPIFVCGNLAWRLEWLPHGQVGDMDDPDNYGLFLRLDSLPGDIESVNARFTISSPCGHYHTDEGSVFSRYNEPMSFGRGNFGKISELTEWIDAVEGTGHSDPRHASPSSSSSSSSMSSSSSSTTSSSFSSPPRKNKLLTVFEVSVSINVIHRMNTSHRPIVAAGNSFNTVVAQQSGSAVSGAATGHRNPFASAFLQQPWQGASGAVGDIVDGNNNANNSRPPNEPERAPPESLDDIDVDGIRNVLRRHRLEKYLNEVIDLGVEEPSDMVFLNREDLSRIGCNVVQIRKFEEMLGEIRKNDGNGDDHGNLSAVVADVEAV